jgi:hypothetical protein
MLEKKSIIFQDKILRLFLFLLNDSQDMPKQLTVRSKHLVQIQNGFLPDRYMHKDNLQTFMTK